MLTVLPVQVINAGIEKDSVKLSSMQVNMAKTTQAKHECIHALAKESKEIMGMPCCKDSSHQCDGCDSCGDCTQATTAMILLSTNLINSLNLNIQKIITSHLSLNGIPQKYLIRPPRILI